MTDPTIAAWSRESDLLFQLRQLREEKERALQDSERHRMQLAAICTAAIGYWKEGDNIHPDYNTLALRDVAKLYAKYAALYNAQHEYHAVIAGALFDFMGWLTSRPKRIMLSSVDDASPAVDAIKDFAKLRGLSLDDAKVQDWQDILKPVENKMAPTEKAIRDFCGHHADWWPSTTQVQEMLALAKDQFNPDWNTEAVLVEEMQRMAKRIEDLGAMLTRQTARIVDLQTHIENFGGGRMTEQRSLKERNNVSPA